jgi:hypothetical protein
MILPSTVDIDRLHDVTERLTTGTGSLSSGAGKTVAYLNMMFGEYELGDPKNTYVYIGDSAETAHHVMWDLFSLITKHDGELAIASRTMNTLTTEHGQRFIFTTSPSVERAIKGRTIHRAFLDIDQDTGDAKRIFHAMLPHLHPNGDIA